MASSRFCAAPSLFACSFIAALLYFRNRRRVALVTSLASFIVIVPLRFRQGRLDLPHLRRPEQPVAPGRRGVLDAARIHGVPDAVNRYAQLLGGLADGVKLHLPLPSFLLVLRIVLPELLEGVFHVLLEVGWLPRPADLEILGPELAGHPHVLGQLADGGHASRV